MNLRFNGKLTGALCKKIYCYLAVGTVWLTTLACFKILEVPASHSQSRGVKPSFTSAVTGQIIVTSDDRKDYYAVTDALKGEANSVAILVMDAVIDKNKLKTKTLGEVKTQLCLDEPFRDQPIIYHKKAENRMVCSSFLVAPDVIATAGHCIDTEGTESANKKRLDKLRFVFGFRMNGKTTADIEATEHNVYSGKRFIGCSGDSDWALIKLDRPVTGRTPTNISVEPLLAGQPVHAIGYPLKLPVKIAGNATVQQGFTESYFKADLDVFGGNSGSPVFSSPNTVIGILVKSYQGEFDYRDSDGSKECLVSRKCSQDDCIYSQSTRATKFSECLANFDSPNCRRCFDWNAPAQ